MKYPSRRMRLVGLCLSRILDIITAIGMKRTSRKWWPIVPLREIRGRLIWATIIGSSMIRKCGYVGYDVNVRDYMDIKWGSNGIYI
jgi:hypothetical protein